MTVASTAEIGPASYPLGVGRAQLTVVSDGVFGLPAPMLASNEDPGTVERWLGSKGLPHDTVTSPVNVWLIRLPEASGQPGRVVMVDSGVGASESFGEHAGLLFDRLARSGFDVASVTDLVLTHLHSDHIGGALLGAERGLFSSSLRVHVSEDELAFWSGDTSVAFERAPCGPEIGAGMTETARVFLEVFGTSIRPFRDGEALAPGLTAWATPGHTPGHAGVRLESDGESAVILGDAVNLSTFERVEWEFFFDVEPRRAVETRRAILRDVCDRGELISATHVSFPALGRVTPGAAGSGYRFNPITWAH